MKGKSIFTKKESNSIIELIRKKLQSNQVEQKRLRDKIRAIGFYASDLGIGGGYTEFDFLRVVKITGVGASPNKTRQISSNKAKSSNTIVVKGKRADSDETYIINLCDDVLKLKASRQHKFDFLRGDAGTPLPVDAFYPTLNLVIEYREKQHTEEIKLFDQRQTVSGVSRGEQRKIYDQRRRDVLPEYNIKLIEFGYEEFEHNYTKRLIRNKIKDFENIHNKLKIFIKM